MPWAKFDDRFPSNRKIALLSDRAFRLYVTAVCWSAENSTDGVIEREELRLIASYRGVNRAVTELIERGLWIATDDGWCIHDFLDYNPSREQVLRDRKANAARQERFRQRKNGKPTPPPPATDEGDETPDNAGSNGRSNGVTNAAPARPGPTRTPYGGEGRCAPTGSSGRAHETAHTPIPATFQPSSESREWARAEGHLDRLGGATALADVTAAFIDWHAGKGTLAADPDALWRKWVREQHTAPRADSGGVVVPLHGAPRGGGTDGRVSDHFALIAEMEAAREAQQ